MRVAVHYVRLALSGLMFGCSSPAPVGASSSEQYLRGLVQYSQREVLFDEAELTQRFGLRVERRSAMTRPPSTGGRPMEQVTFSPTSQENPLRGLSATDPGDLPNGRSDLIFLLKKADDNGAICISRATVLNILGDAFRPGAIPLATGSGSGALEEPRRQYSRTAPQTVVYDVTGFQSRSFVIGFASNECAQDISVIRKPQ